MSAARRIVDPPAEVLELAGPYCVALYTTKPARVFYRPQQALVHEVTPRIVEGALTVRLSINRQQRSFSLVSLIGRHVKPGPAGCKLVSLDDTGSVSSLAWADLGAGIPRDVGGRFAGAAQHPSTPATLRRAAAQKVARNDRGRT